MEDLGSFLDTRTQGGKRLNFGGTNPGLIQNKLGLSVGLHEEIKEILLTESKLEVLPDEIFLFTLLETLVFSKNKGCLIPDIRSFEHLKRLSICCNGYFVLPDTIWEHRGLEELCVGDNNLDKNAVCA